MSAARRLAVATPIVALTVALALTGCSRLGSGPGSGAGSTGAGAPVPAATTSTAATSTAVPPSTLSGISSDLGSADTANQQSATNAAAADQAGATNDEP